MRYALNSVFCALLATAPAPSNAGVTQIDGGSAIFAGANTITFSEVPPGSVNPIIGPAQFGSFFAGQSLSNCVDPTSFNCVVGSPSGPLALAPGGTAAVVADPAHANSPVLGGSLDFILGYPIAILFADDVAAVSLLAGAFNNLASTRVAVFGRDGALLASALNTGEAGDPSDPIDFFTFAFASSDGAGQPTNAIAGLVISIIGTERQGFTIDDVRTVVADPQGRLPEPASLSLLALALLSAGTRLRRQIQPD